jgi:hypothetical protein
MVRHQNVAVKQEMKLLTRFSNRVHQQPVFFPRQRRQRPSKIHRDEENAVRGLQPVNV